MFRRSFLTVILSAILFFQVININTVETVAEERLKGIWVSTVMNLDYPSTKTKDASILKKEADTIIEKCSEMGITDIFFQVRPTADAFYKSEFYPWSQYLTGSQGTAPTDGFDPLEYWIDKCHSKDMRLHAWINPYRVTNQPEISSVDSLAISNPARQNPQWVIKYEGKMYFDPAVPEVRQLVIDGVMEIVENYDVDGIHFDDYFYPGQNFNDDASYSQYGNGKDRAQWRRENVDTLIKALNENIKRYDSDIQFGISPSGVWANKKNNELGSNTSGSESYYKLYADTRKWALEGWIDYIAPQIYWEIGHSSVDYKTIAQWWADTLKNSQCKLYIGLADYKCDGAGASSPWHNGNAIKKQLDLNSSINKIQGEIHFRYKFIVSNPYLYDIVKSYGGKTAAAFNDSTADTNVKAYEQTTKAQETTVKADDSTAVSTEAAAKTTETAAVKTESTTETTTEFKIPINKSDEIMVYVNNKKVEFDQKPVIVNSRTLVPFRKIFEALGAEVLWRDEKGIQQATAVRDNKTISFVIGEKTIVVDKTKTVPLDVAPQIMSSRAMVPLRALSENLGLRVQWDNDNKTITITG